MASQVQSYFEGVAAGYHGASHGWVWRLVRRREERALLAAIGAIGGRDVLELGCGAGYYTRTLLAHGARHVWAVDFAESMLAELPKAGATPVHGDATTVDPGRTFDLIVSAGMLEFVSDPAAVLANARRLANAGATLALLVPTDGVLGRGYRAFHRRNGLSIRLFGRESLARLAEPAGWRLAAFGPAGPYSAAGRLERRA